MVGLVLGVRSAMRFMHSRMLKTTPALKAVSQNLMHANISITDGVYGVLSSMDVKGEIAGLGKR